MDEQQENQMNEGGDLMEPDNPNIAMDTDKVSENFNSLESFHSTGQTSILNFATFESEEKSGEDGHVYSVVRSLAEEIDFIKIRTEHLVQGENQNVDDYFMDVIDDQDDDDFYKDTIEDKDYPPKNEEDEEILSPKSFNSLQDAISSEAFRKTINVPVNKTVGEVIFMILKFVLVHALSLTEITDLLDMINCIFSESVLPNTSTDTLAGGYYKIMDVDDDDNDDDDILSDGDIELLNLLV
ncbi:uncharacterized protein LOC117173608 [Belonocnema kinseyi]|uniref:uncharacterized protein LOC117173608 n=1 Tax=Belonocnema kinseyi TaxID=2817044 RepID=UPI00143D995B|nr:uncharacterized protein LOC117173608 [Belonocnema kinseyi]